MNLYYIDYYKDFCNTYTVYAVARADAGRFEAAFPDADRISRARAIERGISRVREAKRDGEQWFAGLCEGQAANNLPWNATISDRLNACAADTMGEVVRVEDEREFARECAAALHD